nr:unnamed protein product [Digitaria exilis]
MAKLEEIHLFNMRFPRSSRGIDLGFPDRFRKSPRLSPKSPPRPSCHASQATYSPTCNASRPSIPQTAATNRHDLPAARARHARGSGCRQPLTARHVLATEGITTRRSVGRQPTVREKEKGSGKVSSRRRDVTTWSSPAPCSVGLCRRLPRRRRWGGGAGRRLGFVDEGHLGYYEAAAPRRKAVEAVARDLARIRAMGLVAGDAAKEKILSELNLIKDEEYKMKKTQKEEKASMKALKQQEKEAKKAATTAMMECEDESSESSESDCEDEQAMNVGQGMVISAAVPEVVASDISTVSAMECEKAAMKAMKKMEKEQMKAMKKMEKEQKKAAKKAMKMEKEAKKMAMATLNGCMDEDDSSCSSESSDSEYQGEVVRMSRCATITAPETPSPSAVFPIVVPQIPASLPPELAQASEPATAVQVSSTSNVAVAETSTANRIEVCMGGKCKKSGALALLQEFEKTVGTGGAVVGCKCVGKCGLGPNVRLRSEVSAEGSAKRNRLCIGVGLEDVGTIVAGLFGDGDLGMTPA